MYCIGLKENYYKHILISDVVIVREERERKKKRCVPEVTVAEHASKRYSNEMRCFGKRCCVGPGTVTAW